MVRGSVSLVANETRLTDEVFAANVAFLRENIAVAARRPREKPNRSKENKAERVEIGKALAARPASFYLEKVDHTGRGPGSIWGGIPENWRLCFQ